MNDSTNQAKQDYILNIEEIIKENGFTIEDKDLTRPWGAFFRLKDTDAERFLDLYFPDIKDQFITYIGLSPKYLLIEPNKKLSWQYHYRRAEHWRVVGPDVGVKLSDNDAEPTGIQIIKNGGLVQFAAQKRHRLVGLDKWGIVAEIWEHTDTNHPSDEVDIIRVADDFGR